MLAPWKKSYDQHRQLIEKYRDYFAYNGLSSQRKSILNIHWKNWCWSWSPNTFGHLMWKADSLEKILILGKIEGKRRNGWQRMWWSDSITDSMDMSFSKLWEMVKDREAWHAAVHGVAKRQTRLRDWTTIRPLPFLCLHPWSSAVPPEPALLVLDSFSSVCWAPSVADTMLDTQDGKDPNSRSWGLSAVTSVQPCSPVWLYDPMDRSTPGIPVHHQLQELSQTHDPSAGDAIQPSHPLLSSSPPAFNLSQHQGLFQWVSALDIL